MSPRAVVCHKEWTLQPDREPDAAPITYAMQCGVCDESSPTSTDFAEPQGWVLEHGGRNPSHHTYREITTRPWRAWWRP
ncbi:hypothetical protein [Streptomyces sp. NRRL B-3648]|uniref:DUF7848 domain-containing protein n=1 Tax=Streptomyces sp. NRRL B-3648 TaxID=1519493 RepID=UPI0006AF69B4|nr:hypothetical protein [Streptomyces sp. NRRL B-3648]